MSCHATRKGWRASAFLGWQVEEAELHLSSATFLKYQILPMESVLFTTCGTYRVIRHGKSLPDTCIDVLDSSNEPRQSWPSNGERRSLYTQWLHFQCGSVCFLLQSPGSRNNVVLFSLCFPSQPASCYRTPLLCPLWGHAHADALFPFLLSCLPQTFIWIPEGQ